MLNKNTLYYLTFMVLSAAVSLLKNFGFFAKLLGDVGLGYFSLLALIGAYGTYLCGLGISDGLLRNLSILRGKGEEEKAVELRNTGFFYICIISLAVFSVYLFITAIIKHDEFIFYLLAGFFYIGVLTFFSFAIMDLRTRNALLPFSLALFLKKSAVSFLLGLVAAIYLDFMWVFLFETITLYLLLIFLIKYWIKDVAIRYKPFSKIADTMKLGLPVTMGSLMRNFSVNADKWFVANYFSIATFGQYSFAMLVPTAGLLALNIINQYIGGNLLRGYGKHNNLKIIYKSTGTISLVILIIAFLFYFPFKFFLNQYGLKFFPQFSQGIALMLIVYIGATWQMSNFFDWVITAKGNTKLMFYNNFTVMSLTTVSCFVSHQMDAGLITYAWIYSAGRGMNFAFSFIFATYSTLSSSNHTKRKLNTPI